MHATRARADHGFHEFVGIEHAAKAGFGIGHDGRVVVDIAFVARAYAFGPLDFIGAGKGIVDALHHFRHRVHGVERLVRVHGGIFVAVGGDLPAGQVNGFDAGLDLLHGLAAGQRAKAIHIGLVVEQVPQLVGATAGQGVLHLEGAPQAHHVSGRIAALDALPAGVGGPFFFQLCDLLFAAELFGERLRHRNS